MSNLLPVASTSCLFLSTSCLLLATCWRFVQQVAGCWRQVERFFRRKSGPGDLLPRLEHVQLLATCWRSEQQIAAELPVWTSCCLLRRLVERLLTYSNQDSATSRQQHVEHSFNMLLAISRHIEQHSTSCQQQVACCHQQQVDSNMWLVTSRQNEQLVTFNMLLSTSWRQHVAHFSDLLKRVAFNNKSTVWTGL